VTLDDLRGVAVNGLPEVQAILLVIVSLIAMRLTLNSIGRGMRRARIDLGTQILVKRALVIVWLVVTALIVLGMLGVNPTGLVAILGTVGLAFGLALQDILKNFFSGVYLLLERPFRVGDTIKVKDQTGIVENVGVRTTQLRTADNIQVLVPNATVFSEVVANHTFARPPTPAEESMADGHPESTGDPSLHRG
jgi:small conductance mechanosensitive channel